ncbi:MAG: hypothetical protein O2835_08925 [Proteobacteria bacterium]|nr:hypothetical protein [Pseudomonadota bacterium]MDA0961010.1 hypothetical protein [Pseudomonadota bacterium]MDA1152604.1 hypothetical protein [Pseudomonadota bacterium]
MLSLDKKVNLTCIDNDQIAAGTIVRIQGSRVDVALDQGGLLISLQMKKSGLYVGSQSGLEFMMKI